MRPHEIYAEMVKSGKLRPDVQLQPHQHDAIQRFEANPTGGLLLAHGTGTGKTPSSAAIFEHLKSKGKARRALVVVPASLRENYIEGGVQKFTDSSATKLGPLHENGSHHIDGKLPNSHYYVVSNEMFRKDPHKYIDRTGADTVIWDEAHKGRSEQSLNFNAMRSIRPRVKNFIALSGTPVMNHPHDIVPLLDIVTNGKHRLGSSGQFDRMFVGQRVNTHGPLSAFGIGTKTVEPVLKNTRYLSEELNKHIHYVPVESVAKSMPKKVVHNVEVEMSDHQKSLYDFTMSNVRPDIAHKIRNNIPVGSSEAKSILAKIIKSRQLSNSVHTMDKNHDPLRGALSTPKMQRMLDDVDSHLKANPKHKVIVYSNLVHGGVDATVAGLKHRGHDPGVFIGSTHQDKAERVQHIQDYLSGRRRVMVINSAGVEGLNLPGTTMHATLDPTWNPEVTTQQEARGIRSGSPVKEVHVHRYTSVAPKRFGFFKSPETTVDQWVYGVAARKTRLNNQLLGLLKKPEVAKA